MKFKKEIAILLALLSILSIAIYRNYNTKQTTVGVKQGLINGEFLGDSVRVYNGTNYTKIKASTSLSSDYTLYLPEDDGDDGENLTTDGNGNLSWEATTGWDDLSDMALAQGNVYVGDASNNPGATSTVYVASKGYIGIGTTSPSRHLTIENNTNGFVEGLIRNWATGNNAFTSWKAMNDAGHFTVIGQSGTGNLSVPADAGTLYSQGYGTLEIINDGNEAIKFSTDAGDGHNFSFTEKMRLSADGKLGIGTTTPAYELDVFGNIYSELGFIGDLTGNSSTATALASNPDDCSSNQFANAIDAGGNLTCSAIADADVPNDITINLASQATALASNGSNCSSGQAPLGVDASGAVESCFDVWTEAENTSAGYLKKDGSVALTSAWAVGGYNITGISVASSSDMVVDDTLNVGGETSATSTITGNLLFESQDETYGCYFVYGATTTLECY